MTVLSLLLARAARWRLRPVPLALVLALSACSTVDVDVPEARKAPARFDQVPDGAPIDAAALDQWWLGWNDPVLTELIEQGLSENSDIRIAQARLEEARGMAGVVDSALYPQIGASGMAQRGKMEIRKPAGLPEDTTMITSYLGGFTASWEVDVFGGRRSDSAAAASAAQARQEALYGARLTVAGDIARNYHEARGIAQRLKVLDRSIAATERLRRYALGRYDAGQATRYEVGRATAQADAIKAQRPLLTSEYDIRVRRIAVLTGRTPQSLAYLPAVPASAATPAPPAGMLPSDVLARRPDVRGRADMVNSYAARLGSAKADLLPRFFLNFMLQDGRVDFSTLGALQGTAGLLGAGVTLPIFTAGRIKSNIAASDARLREALASYDRSILDALEDVDNAYGMRRGLDERERLLVTASESAADNARQAGRLYDAGRQTLQDVLDAQLDALRREDELAQVRMAQANATVRLFQSLGGGWPASAANTAPDPARDGAVPDRPGE
ncbi:efflux transporter outer membrane subunit [Bordetella genomosp. 1]|uniref:RND transporter n=1 Tax=Bordetella genomosp. 1 TaxID=1395607 RepID=A0ABX4F5T8_9BORD|nr:TolC family protein [Bordetella genomosp. 1]OZI69042.1 RND transporter [Bordetella genomosp. 1]